MCWNSCLTIGFGQVRRWRGQVVRHRPRFLLHQPLRVDSRSHRLWSHHRWVDFKLEFVPRFSMTVTTATNNRHRYGFNDAIRVEFWNANCRFYSKARKLARCSCWSRSIVPAVEERLRPKRQLLALRHDRIPSVPALDDGRFHFRQQHFRRFPLLLGA